MCGDLVWYCALATCGWQQVGGCVGDSLGDVLGIRVWSLWLAAWLAIVFAMLVSTSLATCDGDLVGDFGLGLFPGDVYGDVFGGLLGSVCWRLRWRHGWRRGWRCVVVLVALFCRELLLYPLSLAISGSLRSFRFTTIGMRLPQPRYIRQQAVALEPTARLAS